MINNNCGYDGDLELALIPESFRTDVLKETLDSKRVLIENSEVELAAFALLFEFDGDQKHIRHVLYNCSASRPGIEGKTNEDSKEVQTEKLSLKAVPLSNGMVKAKEIPRMPPPMLIGTRRYMCLRQRAMEQRNLHRSLRRQ